MANRSLVKVAVGVLSAGAAFSAHAIPVVGTSYGAFSNLESCDTTGGDKNCRITSSDSGASTQVQWGSQDAHDSFENPSRLVSVDVGINTSTGASGVKIAQLDWYNSATIASDDLSRLAVAWSLTLAFTSPSGPDANATEIFNLTIDNPINPAADEIRGLLFADLNNLNKSIDLSGVSITNLRYVVTDGTGNGGTTFSNNVWYNDENNWASLSILADFRPRTTTTSVPEPGSLVLLGLGLLGAGVVARRRREQTQNA